MNIINFKEHLNWTGWSDEAIKFIEHNASNRLQEIMQLASIVTCVCLIKNGEAHDIRPNYYTVMPLKEYIKANTKEEISKKTGLPIEYIRDWDLYALYL